VRVVLRGRVVREVVRDRVVVRGRVGVVVCRAGVRGSRR